MVGLREIDEGETALVKEDTFAWNWHFNGREVTALESGRSGEEVRVRCLCCDVTINVDVADLEDVD